MINVRLDCVYVGGKGRAYPPGTELKIANEEAERLIAGGHAVRIVPVEAAAPRTEAGGTRKGEIPRDPS